MISAKEPFFGACFGWAASKGADVACLLDTAAGLSLIGRELGLFLLDSDPFTVSRSGMACLLLFIEARLSFCVADSNFSPGRGFWERCNRGAEFGVGFDPVLTAFGALVWRSSSAFLFEDKKTAPVLFRGTGEAVLSPLIWARRSPIWLQTRSVQLARLVRYLKTWTYRHDE
jgi:hypothetical protein